jgi:smad nuclear-interacting protein 1
MPPEDSSTSDNLPSKPSLPPVIVAQSGKLAEEQNTVHGVVLKYTEPEEARMPTEKYVLVVFKQKECLGEFKSSNLV